MPWLTCFVGASRKKTGFVVGIVVVESFFVAAAATTTVFASSFIVAIAFSFAVVAPFPAASRLARWTNVGPRREACGTAAQAGNVSGGRRSGKEIFHPNVLHRGRLGVRSPGSGRKIENRGSQSIRRLSSNPRRDSLTTTITTLILRISCIH